MNLPEKQNLKVVISYDGTNYNGYQSQKNGIGIEDVIKKSLFKIHRADTPVICAGRTDSGVHAEGQVINFFTDKFKMTGENWIGFFNSELPHDIKVMSVDPVPPTFNARRSAKAREYRYQIVKGHTISALLYRYAVTSPYRNVTVERINAYGKNLVGIHDFTSFCCASDVNKTKIRNLISFNAQESNGLITVNIKGNAFLYNMIRIIMGTIFKLSKEDAPSEVIVDLLKAKDRQLTGPTAPARGLVFQEVFY